MDALLLKEMEPLGTTLFAAGTIHNEVTQVTADAPSHFAN